MSDPRRANAHHTVAWQGWRLGLPRRWDPVKLEGDATAGHALFADAVQPRLGVRWQTPRARRFDAATAVRRTLTDEVGQLAVAEATSLAPPVGDWESPLLYVEPDPPGRDVWVAYSPTSNRLVSLACHVRRREHVLAHSILPTVADLPLDRAAPWSVFGLNLIVPGGFALAARQLNAGDLSLTFTDRRGAVVTARQIAVADLALQRKPLDWWIADQMKDRRRHYRAAGPTSDARLAIGGRPLDARRAVVRRRRRFALATWHPPVLVTLAVHDPERDRLVLLSGTDDDLLRAVADSIGTAV
jgi:hypothetical protein